MNQISFRLPDTTTAYSLDCPRFTEIHDLKKLDCEPGYVFAPFAIDGSFRTLFFHPCTVTLWEFPSNPVFCSLSFEDNSAECYQRYRREFHQCLQHLQCGDAEKIVLSRTLSLKLSREVSEEMLQQLFIVACQHYPHSFVSLVRIAGESNWLIATPEVLLRQTADEQWHTMALAATMSIEEAHGLSPEKWSPKDIAEQRIVAEYIVRRMEELGIKATPSPLHTLTAGQIVHLCTDFTMPASASLGEIVSALHPTPAVCGYPTAAAHRIIAATEQHRRAYYAGFSGPIGLSCGTNLYVTLRCMQISGSQACLYAGGGLLPDSCCEREWEETQRKLNTMLHVLQ